MRTLWILSDGKPGHLNQSLGLAEALSRFSPELEYLIKPVSEGWRLLTSEQAPDLVISAGRKTHFWNILVSFRYQARNIVLMRPSFPLFLFDLALIPAHDRPKASSRVIQTQGALNRMQPGIKVPGTGMILIGGPSKHVEWDNDFVLTEVIRIIESYPSAPYIVSSRRTPEALVASLRENGIEVVVPESVSEDWLASKLPVTERVWVTSDSVSMVYEALTAECSTLLIELPRRQDARTQVGLKSLMEQNYFSLDGAKAPLREADRCAQKIIELALI